MAFFAGYNIARVSSNILKVHAETIYLRGCLSCQRGSLTSTRVDLICTHGYWQYNAGIHLLVSYCICLQFGAEQENSGLLWSKNRGVRVIQNSKLEDQTAKKTNCCPSSKGTNFLNVIYQCGEHHNSFWCFETNFIERNLKTLAN